MDNNLSGKVAVITVGLPATGKTFIARNLCRYLRWIGFNTATFSVSQYRKSLIGDKLRAEFFDPNNQGALVKRTEIANKALQDLVSWLNQSEGQIGILDASNTTRERRIEIYEILSKEKIQVIFLECIYPKNHTVEEHIRELKITCPEYEDLTPEEALMDFTKRIDYYRPNYENLSQSDPYPYIQIFNGGEKIITKDVRGYAPTKIAYFLMNFQPSHSRTIFLADSSLDHEMIKQFGEDLEVSILWSDTRTGIGEACVKPQLEPIEQGEINGLSEEKILENFPEDYSLHQQHQYSHRYPRAESYKDLCTRLKSIIMELEKIDSKVFIYADKSVLKCLYAYYVEIKPKVT